MATRWYTRLTINGATHVYPYSGFKTKRAAKEFADRANVIEGYFCEVFKEIMSK